MATRVGRTSPMTTCHETLVNIGSMCCFWIMVFKITVLLARFEDKRVGSGLAVAMAGHAKAKGRKSQ